jgi:hypothetical protein
VAVIAAKHDPLAPQSAPPPDPGLPEVMSAQLDRLIKAAEAPGIVPFSAQANPGVAGLLYLYERTGQPMVAFCETHGGARGHKRRDGGI